MMVAEDGNKQVRGEASYGSGQTGRDVRKAAREALRAHAGGLGAGLLGSLTLGLAPYVPHAHVWKQLVNLAQGTLTQPIDIFDLLLHGAPWLLLGYASVRFVVAFMRNVRAQGESEPASSR